MVVDEIIMAHPVHETRLANTAVSNHNKLKKKVLLQLCWASSLQWLNLVRDVFKWHLLDILCDFFLIWGEDFSAILITPLIFSLHGKFVFSLKSLSLSSVGGCSSLLDLNVLV